MKTLTTRESQDKVYDLVKLLFQIKTGTVSISETVNQAKDAIVQIYGAQGVEELTAEPSTFIGNPEQVAKAFTKHQQEYEGSPLSEDYKSGYEDGVRHYLEHLQLAIDSHNNTHKS